MRREMTDGLTDGWMDGWTDGLTDGWIDDIWVVGQQENAREIRRPHKDLSPY